LRAGIGQRFLNFCERFGGHFRQRTRTVETSARHYVRGLLQAETKNMERMEEAIPEADHQALQHMLSESTWPERAVLDQVAQDANRLLGGHPDSALRIDESGCPKKRMQSVGVARQWCGQLGKVENCQVGVFAALSRGTEATLIDGRLFLPEAWTSDSARCQAAGIPRAQRGFQRKTDLALPMVAHARQQGLGFAWVGFMASTAAIRPSCAPSITKGRCLSGTCIRISGLTWRIRGRLSRRPKPPAVAPRPVFRRKPRRYGSTGLATGQTGRGLIAHETYHPDPLLQRSRNLGHRAGAPCPAKCPASTRSSG
jgi:hypothetical protein